MRPHPRRRLPLRFGDPPDALGGFRPTTDPAELGRVRTAVICAPTPSAPTAPSTSPPSATRPAPSPPGCARTPPSCSNRPCPRHHRELRAPSPRRGIGAARRPRLPPRVLPQPPRPRQPHPRLQQHPQGHRWPHPGLHRIGRHLLRQAHRQGRTGPRAARGRDDEGPGDQLPARQHRAGQRDGGALPRPRRRPLGRHPVCRDQAVRLPAVPSGPRRRRSLPPVDPGFLPYSSRTPATRCGWSRSPRRSTTGCRAT